MQDHIKYTPIRVPRSEHTLSRNDISSAALKVLHQLHSAGYQAFLVGGGVRDGLLGRHPKDFDVVTNALPEQVKSLFLRQCRLIGRRFVLAHVHLNKEIVEVSTFRAHHDKGGGGLIENGRIVRDNVYGTSIEEDVWRRDFTVNALYYDLQDFSLIDYTHGLTDLKAKMIRLIGEPSLRYREDPVRMLRAVRFAAKLDFSIVPSTAEPIRELNALLSHIPPARLYEEILKLFLSGHAVASFNQLRHYDLFKQLFPYTEACFDNPLDLALVKQLLHNTDVRIAENKPTLAAFLLSGLLWPALLHQTSAKPVNNAFSQENLLEVSQHLFSRQMHHVFIPKRVLALMQEIWLLQLRLTGRHIGNKKSLKILEYPRFRAGYDFLLLRAQVDESLQKYAQWWTQLQEGDESARQVLLSQGPRSLRSKLRRRKKKKKPQETPHC